MGEETHWNTGEWGVRDPDSYEAIYVESVGLGFIDITAMSNTGEERVIVRLDRREAAELAKSILAHAEGRVAVEAESSHGA